MHPGRADIEQDPSKYKQWALAKISNPNRIEGMENAMKNADVLIALSTPGPDTVKPEWIKVMAPKSIVFTCANPVPEIYPYDAKAAGAFIVATGRGDFPNQINNSCGFPGILKGALLVRAAKITDNMAIAAAHSLANYAQRRGINPDDIVPKMDEPDVFAYEAADVAMQAIADGVARIQLSRDEVFAIAKADITQARSLAHSMMEQGSIAAPPKELIEAALQQTIAKFGK